MTGNVEERVIPPGEDDYTEETWKLKEQIRRSDAVLFQTWAYFEREYRRETASLLLSTDGQTEVVAFALIHDDGYLSLFGVHPDYRRRGLGTRLVETLLEEYPAITCHTRATNRKAIEFYEHVGFAVRGRIEDYYRDGTDALHLRIERSGGT